MSAPDLSQEMMSTLRDSGAENHTTIFLGAGASTTSGLPGWDELVTRLLVRSNAVESATMAQLLLTRQDPLLVVESARSAFGSTWPRKLRTALYEGVASTDFSPLHAAAVAHALGGETQDTTLATLNFDDLLEQLLQQESGQPVWSRTRVNDDRPDEYVVHHLHGLVSVARTQDVILTLTEFLDVVSQENSWQLQFLRSALGKGALVIAGTSYRDPDVRQWMHAALKEAPVQHAAIVLLAREGFGVSRDQYASISGAIANQWSAINIRPVLLHDYSDAAQVIRELRHVNDQDYTAPQDRARAIWKHHEQEFATLQPAYVSLLRVDAEALMEALDVDTLNLSLWLADGDGKLTRWAAQDREYSDMSALRSVETGYDSPWIAGRALGADVLLIENLQEGGTRRWRSVMALPVPVPHPQLPVITTAVLTLGLPDEAKRYDSDLMWGTTLAEIGDAWGTRLSTATFPTGGVRL